LLHSSKKPIHDLSALVLGTGGAAKAVTFVLDKLKIKYQLVSRTEKKNQITYADIDKKCMETHHLIINTTPLGMSPLINSAPNLPYENLNSQHFLYDLVYNPEVTKFLQMGLNKDTPIMNGLEMLFLQAEKSWSIWSESAEF
jgi:shikimate dehydrogenase